MSCEMEQDLLTFNKRLKILRLLFQERFSLLRHDTITALHSSDSWNLFTWKEFSLFTRKANFHFLVNLLDFVDTIKRRGSEEDARNQVPQKLFTDKSAFIFFLRRTWLCFLLSFVVGMAAGVSWQTSLCADFNSPPLKAITFRQQISCSCCEVLRLKFTDQCMHNFNYRRNYMRRISIQQVTTNVNKTCFVHCQFLVEFLVVINVR